MSDIPYTGYAKAKTWLPKDSSTPAHNATQRRPMFSDCGCWCEGTLQAPRRSSTMDCAAYIMNVKVRLHFTTNCTTAVAQPVVQPAVNVNTVLERIDIMTTSSWESVHASCSTKQMFWHTACRRISLQRYVLSVALRCAVGKYGMFARRGDSQTPVTKQELSDTTHTSLWATQCYSLPLAAYKRLS